MPSPGDWLGFLDARLREAVRQAAAEEGGPEDALRGLFISDAQAHADAAAGPVPGRAGERLRVAAERLALDALDLAVLAVCVAPELDARFGRLYGYLHDDVTRKLATPRLAAELLAGDGVSAPDVLGRLGPRAPLVACGALRWPAPDPSLPLADRPLRPSERLAAFVLEAGPALAEADAPASLRRVAPPAGLTGRADEVRRVRELLAADAPFCVLLCGADAGAVLSAAAGRPLVLVGAHELTEQALGDATLAAALEGAQPALDGLEGLDPAGRARLAAALDAQPRPWVLLAQRPSELVALGDRTVLRVDVPELPFAEREAAWRALAGADGVGDVAAKFRLSLEQIGAAAQVARIAAGGATPGPAELDLGARHASSSRLGELATQLPGGRRWGELVLPARQQELLRSIQAYLRHRDRVLSDWGYAGTIGAAQGLKVLFAGESGTGKTLAAQVLASELGLDLFRVDLATVVSKYIGETEKNLERIFEAADGSNAVLFFDEADALFGKRSEVSDAHDRYANIEVSYLLQRMEGYPGAVILATNFKRNIDDAFVRRLDFVVDFPFPEAEDRRRIWAALLPDAAPRAQDVDLSFLAHRFKLAGGAIRNCSLSAAFQAADDDRPISMRHLVRAVAQEYAKQGRLTLEADFARFHAELGEPVR